jgi:hypothetical protein
MTPIATIILPSQAKHELAGGSPGAWGGAVFAPFARRCLLRDRGAECAGGNSRQCFIGSCSCLFHKGYRSAWYGLVPAPTDETWGSLNAAKRNPGTHQFVSLLVNYETAPHRPGKRCNSRRETVVCPLLPVPLKPNANIGNLYNHEKAAPHFPRNST